MIDILSKMNFWAILFIKRKSLNCIEKGLFTRNIFTLLFIASQSLECKAEKYEKNRLPYSLDIEGAEE